MAVDANWARWLFASTAKYLQDVALDNNYDAVLVESLDDRQASFQEVGDRVEIRISGPITRYWGSGEYEALVDANVLVSSTYEERKNGYTLHQILGLYHAAMHELIPIFKLGDGPEDNPEELIGCLSLRGSRVRVTHLGQIDPNSRIKQGIVDARYVGYFST